MVLRARKVSGPFEKRAPGHLFSVKKHQNYVNWQWHRFHSSIGLLLQFDWVM